MMRSLPSLLCLSAGLGVTLPAAALVPGVYRDGPRQIILARRGNQWCYQGSSRNGTRTATILYRPAAKVQRIYGWHDDPNTQGLVLEQRTPTTLAFGGITYPLTADRVPITGDLQQCLSSSKPFLRFLPP
jgi:hypothetical protein